MTAEEKKRFYKRVALIAFVLGMLCPFLPPEYRTVCEFVSKCSGGF